jgi:hypothetical protein
MKKAVCRGSDSDVQQINELFVIVMDFSDGLVDEPILDESPCVLCERWKQNPKFSRWAYYRFE